MDIVLGFVFLLCLLLLVMIFGEQLSVLGAFHGRWLGALSESIADLWDFLCEEVDRGWSFVLEHLWWVLAVGSGSSGVVLVAWMIFGGIADQATADVSGRSGYMHAGGILDQPQEIPPLKEPDKASFDLPEEPITARIDQVPSLISSIPISWSSDNRRPIRRRRNFDWEGPAEQIPDRANVADDDSPPSWNLDRDFSPEWTRDRDNKPRNEIPPLRESIGRGGMEFKKRQPRSWGLRDTDLDRLPTLEPERRFRPRRGTSDFAEWTEEVTPEELQRDDYADSRTSGRPIASTTLKQTIQEALNRLKYERPDDWRRFDGYSDRSNSGRNGFSDPLSDMPRVPDATYDELDALEASVRIVPGAGVGESDLHIEKSMPATQQKNEVDIEIRVTNQSDRQMSGLLVHEYLPGQVQPVSVHDGGVYRDSTVTWRIDDLRPLETQTVRVRVRSELAREFDTRTIVSATAAVASEIVVESDRRTRFKPFQPSVQLTMDQVPRTARLAEKLEIPFRLSNVGKATAAEVTLRIELPPGLDHFHLKKNDVNRIVVVSVRDLKPNTSRVKMLRLRAIEPGEQTAVVELLVDRGQADLRTFTIRVPADSAVDATEPPRPDDAFPFGRR